MDYEEKYKKALERANEYHFNGVKQCIADTLEYVFPELKESEDEKIKRMLIDYFKKYKENEKCGITTFNRIPTDNILSWLEKQGKQKNPVKIKAPEESLNIDSKTYNEIVNDCIFGEDKPKFKVGDWIISTLPGIKYPHLITDIRDGYYIFGEDDDHAHIVSNDNILKLWTIQDAKDGDVLIDKSGSRECPFIFKETKSSNIKTDILNPLTVLGYCGIGGAGFTKGSGWGDTANCIYYPATKEQRDLLFQKMYEAGYEWDTEKKELKKFHVIDEGKAEMDYCFTKMMNGEKVSSAWSEEDDKWFESLIQTIEDGYLKLNTNY